MPTNIESGRANFNVWQEAGPDYIPQTQEAVSLLTVWVEEITLTGTTGASVTVTVTDGNDLPLVKDVPLAKGEIYQKVLGARKCPGGIKWSASADLSVVGFVRWKY